MQKPSYDYSHSSRVSYAIRLVLHGVRQSWHSMLLIGLLACQSTRADLPPATILWTVQHVYDGDTVMLRPLQNLWREPIKLRISDIDAPEYDQDFGNTARLALMRLCQRHNMLVRAYIVGYDRYRRALGSLECNKKDAATYLVARGLAWEYPHNHNANIHYAYLNARRLKLGLWQSNNPIPPWQWRHR